MTEGPGELEQLLGAEGARRFLEVYLKESRRRVQDMLRAVDSRDVAGVRDAVHALVPTSRWAGATDLAALCEALHRRTDWESIGPEHEDLVSRIASEHDAWSARIFDSIETPPAEGAPSPPAAKSDPSRSAPVPHRF